MAHHHVEGHPLLDVVVARDDPFDRLVEVGSLRLGQEPDFAQVDPQQRSVGAAGDLGPAQAVRPNPVVEDERQHERDPCEEQVPDQVLVGGITGEQRARDQEHEHAEHGGERQRTE